MAIYIGGGRAAIPLPLQSREGKGAVFGNEDVWTAEVGSRYFRQVRGGGGSQFIYLRA